MSHTTKLKNAALFTIMVAATAGCDSAPEEKPTIFLDPVASAPVPFSSRSDGTLVDENTVCVTNSYEVRVECVGRDGAVVGVFGRRGEGPGEFPIAPGLVRGPGATIGAISRNRLTVFALSGAMVSEVPLPLAFLQLAAPFDTTILGQHFGGGSGSVRVRDRLLAYDLYDSTLVTVVEREPDADGIGWRAADWYDIAGLTLGMR